MPHCSLCVNLTNCEICLMHNIFFFKFNFFALSDLHLIDIFFSFTHFLCSHFSMVLVFDMVIVYLVCFVLCFYTAGAVRGRLQACMGAFVLLHRCHNAS